jgi:ATP synthase protein I
MPDPAKPDPETSNPETACDRMLREVSAKQDRMLRARSRQDNFWSSLELLGVVGWSVALPTLLGAALGIFVDRRWPTRFSWTVMLLFAGLIFGCTNAWFHMQGKDQ